VTHHPRVRLRAGGFSDLVDRDLAPLLREIWLAGIETMSSCQDAGESIEHLAAEYPHMEAYIEVSRGRAYIDFLWEEDAARFFSLIAAGGPSDALRHRLTHWLAEGHWQTIVSMSEYPDAPDTFGAFMYQVSFPKTDIAEAIVCLQRATEDGPSDPAS
jgi:hypothetical protein